MQNHGASHAIDTGAFASPSTGNHAAKPPRLLRRLRDAAAQARRPLHTVLLEALTLRVSANALGLNEYLDFKLHLSDLDLPRKREFVGGRGSDALKLIVSDERARFIVRDKLTTYTLLQGFGFAVPAVRAIYRSRRPATLKSLHSAEELANYLRDPANLPVYLKPSWGSKGSSNALLQSCDGTRLVLGDGSVVALKDFIASLDDGRTLGWLLQEPLRAHPALRSLTGTDKVSSIRLCTVHDGRNIHPYQAILKINRGDSDNDDFWNGALGNAVGAIDMATGRLTRVVSGAPDAETLNAPHPKTGQPTLGFCIPHWQEVVALATEAHRMIPTMACPHWDIAVTDRGPVILEINSFGSTRFIQRAHRRGFVTPELLHHLRNRANVGLLDPDMLRMDPLTWSQRIGLERWYWLWRHKVPMLRYASAQKMQHAHAPAPLSQSGMIRP